MTKARVTSKGQITIPKPVRDRLGLRAGDEVEFVEDASGIHLRKELVESPFKPYRGFLKQLKGQDPDQLIEEIRGK
jgi:antitoxin PrlF